MQNKYLKSAFGIFSNWLGYRVKKCMATLILYLRSKWHACIAVVSRFVWYSFL